MGLWFHGSSRATIELSSPLWDYFTWGKGTNIPFSQVDVNGCLRYVGCCGSHFGATASPRSGQFRFWAVRQYNCTKIKWPLTTLSSMKPHCSNLSIFIVELLKLPWTFDSARERWDINFSNSNNQSMEVCNLINQHSSYPQKVFFYLSQSQNFPWSFQLYRDSAINASLFAFLKSVWTILLKFPAID